MGGFLVSAHACGGEDGAYVTGDRCSPGLTRGQFRREGGRPAERIVLPGDRASRQLRQRMVGHPRDERELPIDPSVAARGPDQIEVLVEPDRQMRTQPQDQCVRDPRLALRQGVRPGVVDPEQRPPMPGEVAVQVDAVRILARVCSDSVRIQVGDDPEIEIVG